MVHRSNVLGPIADPVDPTVQAPDQRIRLRGKVAERATQGPQSLGLVFQHWAQSYFGAGRPPSGQTEVRKARTLFMSSADASGSKALREESAKRCWSPG